MGFVYLSISAGVATISVVMPGLDPGIHAVSVRLVQSVD